MQVTDLTTTAKQRHESAPRHRRSGSTRTARSSATHAIHAERRRRRPGQAGHQCQQLRRFRRRPDRPEPRVLLRHLRRRAAAERGHAQRARSAGRVARRRPVERLRPDPQSRHRPAVRRQPDPGERGIGENPRRRSTRTRTSHTGGAINAPNFIVNAPGDYTVDGFDGRADAVCRPTRRSSPG